MNMLMRRIRSTTMVFVAILGIAFSLTSCRSVTGTDRPVKTGHRGTYIVNEGGFGGGGSVSFYDRETRSLTGDVIKNAGNWFFPNDILITEYAGYLVVNGSDRIEVLDIYTDSVKKTISCPTGSGPGFIVTDGTSLYIANYDGSVSMVDPVKDSIRTVDGVVGFPGGIEIFERKLFVSDLGAWPDTGSTIKVLDAISLEILDSITLGGGPGSMVVAGGRLFVATGVSRKVFNINPSTLAIEDSSQLSHSPGDLVSDGVFLYVLTPVGVERISIPGFLTDSTTFITRQGGLFYYALAYDFSMGELMVSNIVSPGGSGVIEVYDRGGTPIGSPLPAGIFPGAFGSTPGASAKAHAARKVALE
jgi:hypothetical protein